MTRTYTQAVDQVFAAAKAWRQKRVREATSQLANLTPRVVVRDDGFAYITFTRPRSQKGTP